MHEVLSQSSAMHQVANLIREKDRFLVVSHLRPDGDSLGSQAAMLLALQAMGKQAAAWAVEPIHQKWSFLPGSGQISSHMPQWTPEATLVLDCGAAYRVAEGFEPVGIVVDIDHHLSNDMFGDVNWVDPDACATGEQIYDLLGELEVPLTREIATALYVAVMTDTGGFRYSNTTARSFRIAADCVAAGADPAEVGLEVFETRPAGEFAIRAKVYGSLRFEFDGAFVWSEVRMADYEAAGGEEMEPEGLSSDIRGIEGVEISLLLHEMPEGNLRANFRGKGQVDCSAIATACGGGGHFNAAGAVVRDKPYEEARDFVLRTVRDAVGRWKRGQAG